MALRFNLNEYLDISEQKDHMLRMGLKLKQGQVPVLLNFLNHENYYQVLTKYARTFIQQLPNGEIYYAHGLSLDDLMNIVRFDRELATIIFPYLMALERKFAIALTRSIVECSCLKSGAVLDLSNKDFLKIFPRLKIE